MQAGEEVRGEDEEAGTKRFRAKRDAILAAAAEAINEQSAKGMTFADVARRVGLNTTSVTYYFKRKEDLAAACFENTLERLHAMLDEALAEATGGRGAASVIDAVGNDTTMTAALTCVRPGGTVSVVGVHDLNPFPFPALMSLVRSVTLRMTTAPVQQTWPQLIPLIQSGRLDTRDIFTHSMSLDDAPAAYAAVAARSADCVKIALTP